MHRDVESPRAEHAALQHLWGVILPSHGGRRIASLARRHYTGPGRPRGADGGMAARASSVIPRTRLVTLDPIDGIAGAPEILLAAIRWLERDPYAVVAVLPADHLAEHGHRLVQYVARAAAAAALRPDLPIVVAGHSGSRHPDYAWVEPGEAVDGLEAFGVRAIERLVWRPSALERASGLRLGTTAVVCSARTLVALGRRYVPDVLECLEPLEHVIGRPEETLLRSAVWESMPRASLTADLLAHVRDLGVVAMPDAVTSERPRPDLQALAS